MCGGFPMTTSQCSKGSPLPRRRRVFVIAVALTAALCNTEARAWAQTPRTPNSGAITLTGGVDVASVYVFRGFVQEADPKLTLFPYADIGIAITSGDGAIKSTVVNVGVWNSLNTGSSGTNGPSGHAHFE